MKKIIKWSLLTISGLFILLVIASFVFYTPDTPQQAVGTPEVALASPATNRVPFEQLSNENKKTIHAAIVASEVKARKEAEVLYETDPSKPNYTEDSIYKKHDLQTELQEKYKLEVYEKYNISKETAIKIIGQGIEEDWEVELGY